MIGKRIFGTVLVIGLGAGLVSGQQPNQPNAGIYQHPPRQVKSAQQKAALQEDIEIMRRLLNRSLNDVYGSALPVSGFFRRAAINPTGEQMLKHFLDVSSSAGVPFSYQNRWNPSVLNSSTRAANLNSVSGDVLNLSNDGWAEVVYFGSPNQRLPLTTEGTYLKGHGVVFTLTMPPHDKIEAEPLKSLAIGYCAKCHDQLPQKLVLNEVFQEKDSVVKVMAEKIEQTSSAWEQTRREVRGVKEEPKKDPPPAPAKKQYVCGPSVVVEAVLRTLAENGRHFSHLTPDENLSVVITFRPMSQANLAANDSFWLDLGWPAANRANPANGVAMVDFDNDGRVDLYVANNANGQASLYTNNGNGTFTNQKLAPESDAGANIAQGAPKNDQEEVKKAVDKAVEYLKRNQSPGSGDYELLGDLHLKQKRYEDAVKAFEKAIQENPNSVGLRSKYLEALKSHVDAIQKQLEADKPKLDEVRKQLLDAANEYAKALGGKKEEPAAQQPPPPPPLPVKLTISAPKRVLDLVGAGKMSFEEFKKSPDVTVEYTQPATPSEKK